MKLKAVSGMMLTLLLIGMLTLAFNIQPVKSDWTWTETIYIRVDGSVYPDTAPISSVDNVTYTLTDNIVGDVPKSSSAIIVERDNIVVDGAGYTLQGTGSGTGINLTGRSSITIKNMKIEAFECGILLEESSNSTISENSITNNIYGVFLDSSSENTLSENNITDNGNNGIWLEKTSNNNSISENNITKNGIGIELYYSSNNSVSGNIITSNHYGIELYLSSNNRLRNNILADNDVNFVVLGKALSGFINDVDQSNTADSKKIYYLINQRDFSVPSDAGFVALVNCTNTIVKNLKPKNNIPNILLAYTQNSTITKNNIINSINSDLAINIWLINSSSNNVHDNNIEKGQNGIYLSNSSYNNIYGNNITEITYSGGITLSNSSYNNICGNTLTDGHGMWLFSSSNNVIIQNNLDLTSNRLIRLNLTGAPAPGGTMMLHRSSNNVIYHNNFVMNRNQLYTNESVNIWDNGYPSGGNYWSNYTGVDLYRGPYQDESGGDGIGDTPYVIDDNNQDNYPLMKSWTPTPPVMTATIDIDPDTLNLKSRGRWITCYIELPEGYNVSDIDRATIMLNDTVPVDPFWVDKPLESVVGDYDDDDVPNLMVKFSRAAVIEYLLGQNITYGNVTLTVTGELYDGTLFEGSDMIRAKMPSKAIEKIPSEVDSDDEYVPVMPEFPSFIILTLFMIATLLAVTVYRRKHTV
jgi:parallel beta-helix repeat protein